MSNPANRDHIIAWDKFLMRLRVFLHERGYYEVQTSHLVPAGAFEASIDTLSARTQSAQHELHTSPEMEMKRVIAESHLSIFQICRCFRDDPATPVHRTEFTMLEYYRVFGTYEGLQAEVTELLRALSTRPLKSTRSSVRELFEEHVGVDLNEVQETSAFAAALKRTSSRVSVDDTWQDIFFRAWVEKVEPRLSGPDPILVYDYPIQIAALAAPAADPRYAQRFEIYWHGMELCNGASELNDEKMLLARYEEESRQRRQTGKAPHPRPEVLLSALRHPLPECCGVAIGLERLFAALQGKSSLVD